MKEINYLLETFILLKPGSEIVGRLTQLIKNKSTTTLIFSTQTEIEIPKNSILEDKLTLMIGEKIGLFNCDEKYKIRKIQRGDK